jgi:hypothetical protein
MTATALDRTIATLRRDLARCGQDIARNNAEWIAGDISYESYMDMSHDLRRASIETEIMLTDALAERSRLAR